MTKIIHVAGAKGGVGTTTIAALMGLTAHVRTALVDATGTGDLASILGIFTPEEPGLEHITGLLDFAHGPIEGVELDHDLVIIDDGVAPLRYPLAPLDPDDLFVLVVNSQYTSLRRALGLVDRPDRVVSVSMPGSALNTLDIDSVLNVESIDFPWNPTITRICDAGLVGFLPSPSGARRRVPHSATLTKMTEDLLAQPVS